MTISIHFWRLEAARTMELWWNCVEFFFLPQEYNFQAMLDEFQIPAHVRTKTERVMVLRA